MTGDVGRSGLRTASGRSPLLWARIASLSVILLLMARLAWISDDSLITLRTALNLAHGLGPGFNIDERVQAYTHPLWFLIWSALGNVSGEWILTIVLFSLALAGAAVAVVMWQAATVFLVFAAAASLAFSNAFMEYATSGLENPLAYALSAATIVLIARPTLTPFTGYTRVALIGLGMAALALTRLDLTLLLIPIGVYVVWSIRGSWVRLGVFTATLLVPLVAWSLWSIWTYGGVLPNTFDAKRNLDIPVAELVFQGLRYLLVTVERDPWTGIVIVVGLVLTAKLGGAALRAGALGVVLYIGYVIWIGGDFMAGRFLAVPVLVVVLLSVIAVTDAHSSQEKPSGVAATSWPLVLVVSIVAFVIAPIVVLVAMQRTPSAVELPLDEKWAFVDHAGVSDERGFSVAQGRSLLTWFMTVGAQEIRQEFLTSADADPRINIADLREAAARWPDSSLQDTRGQEVGVACGGLGSSAISTGPFVHWIDPCGLTDAFLAGRPFSSADLHWRMGHFERSLPEGYVEAVRRGDPSLVVDEYDRRDLADLWATIR